MIHRDHIVQYSPCALGSVQRNTTLGPSRLPSGNLLGLGVQNPRPQEIPGASGDVFPNTSLLTAVYGYNISLLLAVYRYIILKFCIVMKYKRMC